MLRLPFAPASPPDSWIGGTIHATPEDFRVEEIPLYPPAGEGDHLFVRVEKRGKTTHEALEALASRLGLPPRAIGFAGRKDKVSISVQTFSVPASVEAGLAGFEVEGVRVLEVARHTRKIAPGHLAGNRFEIVVRGVSDGAADRIGPVAARVARDGVPHYFGPQRFGVRLDNHLVGRALLVADWADAAAWIAGRPSPEEGDARIREARSRFDEGRFGEAARTFPPGCVPERRLCRHLDRRPEDLEGAIRILPLGTRRFYLNAWQSYVFNRVVEERKHALTAIRAGDVAVKPSGVAFVVEDVEEVSARLAAGAVELSAPLPGKRSMIARGPTGEFETELVRAALGGAEPAAALRAARLKGERRAMRLRVQDLAWDVAGDSATFRFALPAGAFATTVLAEFVGPGPAIPRLEDVTPSRSLT